MRHTKSPQALASLAMVGVCLMLSAPRAQTDIQDKSPAPTIDDLINLKRVGTPVISPDGSKVAYTLRETNWDENAYETEIWIADSAAGRPRQLTNARKSSSQPAFSPDSSALA